MSSLKFAADQSCLSLKEVEGIFVKFSKTIGDSAEGSKAATNSPQFLMIF
jgi:hypothetical protein